MAAGLADSPAVPPGPATAAAPAVDPEHEPRSAEGRIGTIPAVGAQRAWAKGQLTNWRLYLVRFLCAGVAVMLTVLVLPGLSFAGWRWGQGLEIAVIFGLLNAFVKPALQFVALRYIFSTYGIVVVLINTVLLGLLDSVMGDRIEIRSLLSLILGGVLVGLIGTVLETLMGADYPMLDRDYKERNGLA